MDEVGERLARVLDRTGEYRILRRVHAPTIEQMADVEVAASGLAVGIVLDTETTGLAAIDEVVELGMVRFAYEPTLCRVERVLGAFSALRQPSRPIPPDVTRLTGIGDADVAGRDIDAGSVARFVAGAKVVIAHNAAFDRPVVERAWPLFADLPWACSLTQVDWRAEGFEGRRLGQLLAERRLFHDGHRALDDCHALLHLLRLPVALGATPFELMSREAATAHLRIWAVHSPYEARAELKARGYRWSPGGVGQTRGWLRDVAEGAEAAEVEWLRRHVYDDPDADPPRRRITALDRFSMRADAACCPRHTA